MCNGAGNLDSISRMVPWPIVKSIHVLAVDSALETQALRAAAEYWGAAVTVTWVGNATDVVDYCASHPIHDVIIIAGHGDERGLLLPSLDESIKGNYPFIDVIRPNDFQTFLALEQNVVLSTACCGGNEKLAAVFLSCGARCYIGAEGYPDGNDALMYALEFLFQFLVRGCGAEQAHQISASASDDRSLFCFKAAGTSSLTAQGAEE